MVKTSDIFVIRYFLVETLDSKVTPKTCSLFGFRIFEEEIRLLFFRFLLRCFRLTVFHSAMNTRTLSFIIRIYKLRYEKNGFWFVRKYSGDLMLEFNFFWEHFWASAKSRASFNTIHNRATFHIQMMESSVIKTFGYNGDLAVFVSL